MKSLPLFLSPAAAIVMALIAALYSFLPEMARRNLLFSVTVPDGFKRSERARRVVRGYRVSVLANGVVAVGVAALVRVQPICFIIAMVWLMAWVLIAVVRARALILPYAAPLPAVREASVAPRARAFEDRFSLQALPFLPLAAAALLLLVRWRDLPQRFPVHWGYAGRPNRWATKTPLHVFGLILFGVILCAFIASVSYFARKWARRPFGGGARAASEARFRSGIAQLTLWCEAFVAVTYSIVAVAPLLAWQTSELALRAVAVLSVVFVAALVWWAARMARRRHRDPSTAPTDLTPDACWKAGIFYVNPEDPALVVERRLGFGYTLNFAHPAAWAIMAGLILIVVGVRFALRR